MSLQPTRPRYAAAIIERTDNHVLIALPPETEQTRKWTFPRGLADPKESVEAALRRIALEQLGIIVELVIGQPPLLCDIDGRSCEIRYFFCGVSSGDAKPGPYSEIRWVTRAHLREYDFDDPSKAVVEWLLTS
jgi:ADP-ribose pyrophosphatase YjhB (NUDIX family)